MYFLKFVTLKVNENSRLTISKLDELIVFFLKSASNFEEAHKKNVWNVVFFQNAFENGLQFIENPNWLIKHSGIVILRHLTEIAGKSVMKRFLKNELAEKLQTALSLSGNELAELKTVQGNEKKLKKADPENQEMASNLKKERESLMGEVEDKLRFLEDALGLLIHIHELTFEAENGVSFQRLIEQVEFSFSHPSSEIHFLLLGFLVKNQIEHPSFFAENPESFSKILVYCFNLLKKRNFETGDNLFEGFFHFMLSVAAQFYPEMLDSSFTIFAKLLSNASVN